MRVITIIFFFIDRINNNKANKYDIPNGRIKLLNEFAPSKFSPMVVQSISSNEIASMELPAR